MILMAAAFVLPTMAQNNQEWHSTSTMQGAGSALSSQVTAVGATSVEEMATVSAAPARGIRTATPGVDDSNYDPKNPNFGPVGDAVLPLLLMSLAFAGMTYIRKRRTVK